jgi:HPt (histidine-containing phosphotransfer) domain-containing protein
MNKTQDESSTTIVVRPPKGLTRELVHEYLEGCQKDLSSVKADLAKLSFECARFCGHQMKGAGSPYGFPILTQLGSAIEQAAIRKDTAELEDLIIRTETYLSRVEVACD